MATFTGDAGNNTNPVMPDESNTLDGLGGNDILTGGRAFDDIDGGDGNDSLSGGIGDDQLFGGAGNDVLFGGNGADTLNDFAGVGQFFGQAGDDTILVIGAGVSPADTVIVNGGVGDDGITANVSDVFDTLVEGDDGDDNIFVFASQSTAPEIVVRVSGGDGDDDITISGTLPLGTAGLPSFRVDAGDGDDDIRGSQGDDYIEGGQGDDVIEGGGGGGYIDGDAGDDFIDLQTPSNENSRTVTLVAGEYDVFGEAGDDIVRPGDQIDRIDGGLGEDQLVFSDDYGVGVTVNLRAGVGAGGAAAGDRYRRIESIVGTGFGDVLTGDGLSNQLDGAAGNDQLTGGIGTDFLDGGDGLDTADYREKIAPVVVTLSGATVATVFVGGVEEDDIVNLENLFGGAAADTLTGDSLKNLIRGAAGADTLDGGAGVDTADYRDKTAAVAVTLNGATFVTVSVGGVAEDQIRNFESVLSGSGADTLFGDALVNTLSAGGGIDQLRGGGGGDTLTGGADDDVFLYLALTDSTVAVAGRDTITDFVSGDDKINVSAIDANGAGAGNTAFAFGAFNGTAGRLQVTAAGAGQWLVAGDVNGDNTADFSILVKGTQPVAGDFVL